MANAITKAAAALGPPRGKRPAKSRAAAKQRKPRSLEDAIVTLATTGQLAEAAASAIRAQRDAGLPITYQLGNDVVREFPDGRREVLATLQPPTYRLPKGVGRIRNRLPRDK